MKTTEMLIIVAIVAVALASINLMITINKVGDFKTLVGFATDTGVANLTIQSDVNINFTRDNLSWGTGYVTTGQTECEMTSQGLMNCTNFATLTDGLTLENIGNAEVTLNLTSSKNVEDFLGGNASVFQWNVTINGTESGACGYRPINISSWTNVTTTSGGIRACDNFSFRNSHDEIQVELRLVLSSAYTGTKGVTITAEGVTYSP
ncbi:MAG: hypothetical protein ABH811_03080 [archaeon]